MVFFLIESINSIILIYLHGPLTHRSYSKTTHKPKGIYLSNELSRLALLADKTVSSSDNSALIIVDQHFASYVAFFLMLFKFTQTTKKNGYNTFI